MWSSEWYWCNVSALAVCLLAQVKRPTQSLWYAASVVASLCQSHVSVMHGQMAESQPEPACQTLGIHHTPASLSARLMEGRREQVFVQKTNERVNAANLKDKIYEIHPTVWIISNSKQSEGTASLPRWFCTWKDASLTRSGSLFSISDSTFPLPELFIIIRKPHRKLHCKNILLHLQ